MSIKLITDSACGLPDDMLEKYNIEVLPFYVSHDDNQYKDGIDINIEKILKDMKEKNYFYKTSQIDPDTFKKAFEKNLKKHDQCLYIGLSTGISGAYNSAVIAKKQLDKEKANKIHLIDSKTASIGQGLIVRKAAKLLNKEKNIKKIKEKLQELKEKTHVYFTVDDLKYLYNGGRLNKVQSIIGGILNTKPLLTVDSNGDIIFHSKHRGHVRIKKKMKEFINKEPREMVNIFYAGERKKANEIKKYIKENTVTNKVLLSPVRVVVGAHIGPNSYGIAYMDS